MADLLRQQETSRISPKRYLTNTTIVYHFRSSHASENSLAVIFVPEISFATSQKSEAQII